MGEINFDHIPKKRNYTPDEIAKMEDDRARVNELNKAGNPYVDSVRVLAELEDAYRDEMIEDGIGGKALEKYSQINSAANLKIMEAEQKMGRDPLTGLGSRALLDMSVPQDLKTRLESSENSSVIFIDFDNFSQINNIHGHDKGDYALKMLAKILNESGLDGHPGDSVYRYGGEEFVVYLPGSDSLQALEAAEKFRSAIANTPLLLGDEPETRTISLGVAGTDNNAKWKKLQSDFQELKATYVNERKTGKDGKIITKEEINEKVEAIFRELLKKADEALYYAKNHGKNQAVIESQKVNKFTAKRKKLDEERRMPNATLDTIEKKLSEGMQIQEIIETQFGHLLPEAFKISDMSLRCPDTRTTRAEGAENGKPDLKKLGLAGSGIMRFPRMKVEDQEKPRQETNSEWFERLSKDEKFIRFIDSLIKKRVKEVTSHEECGAARLMSGKEKGDDDGFVLASFIATELQKNDPTVVFNHLTIKGDHEGKNKMRGEIHNERVMILDGTGNFDPDILGFPGSFLVSGACLEADEEEIKTELQQELKVMCEVVDGHGFGSKRFRQDNPFYIFVTANTQLELDKLMKYANKVANDNRTLPIRVEGFVYDSRPKNQD